MLRSPRCQPCCNQRCARGDIFDPTNPPRHQSRERGGEGGKGERERESERERERERERESRKEVGGLERDKRWRVQVLLTDISTHEHHRVLLHTDVFQRVQHHPEVMVEIRHGSPVTNSEVVLK
jgi:hypothetical protein